MQVGLNEILIAAGAGVWSLFIVYFIYAKTKTDNDLKEFKNTNKESISGVDSRVTEVAKELHLMTQKQVEHEFNFVTEKHVREMLKEEVKDIKSDIITVKGNVGTILESIQSLTIAIGVQNGIREREMMMRNSREGDK